MTIVIPGMHLEEEIGRGAMGVVYRAHREGTEQALAVKVLEREDPSSQLRRRFEREARGMLELKHPNLCRAHDYGVLPSGQLYLVMELLKGEDLSTQLAREGVLSVEEAIRVGVEAADGMTAVHASGLIHRDLKPSNIFLVANDEGPHTVKILDFGLAMFAVGGAMDTRITRTGEVIGTPAFMAPEQARGDKSENEATDVFGLGAVLYQSLAGSSPYGEGTTLQILVRAVTSAPIPITDCFPEIPPAVAAVIMHAIASDQGDRYQNMPDFRDALQAVAAEGSDRTQVSRSDRPIGKSVKSLSEEDRIVTVLLATGVKDSRQVADSIRSHGGQATALDGQVVGVFGGDVHEGDEPERAVRAALAVQSHCLTVGIGTGRAIGTGSTYKGHAVNAAEQSTLIADQGVYVDDATRASIAGRFVLDGHRVRAMVVTPEEDDELPLVGRDADLVAIFDLLERALNDSESVGLLLSGPMGIGKSRLLREVGQRMAAAADAVRLLVVRCDSTQRYRSWGLVGSIVGGAVDIADDASDEDILASIRRVVNELGLPRDCADFVAATLGVPLSADGDPALEAARRDGQVMRDRVVQAVGDFFEALLVVGPIVVLLDDVHWADTPSLELIDILVRRLERCPYFVLMTGEPHTTTDRAALFEKLEIVQRAVPELSRSDSTALARAQGVDAATAAKVAEHAAGNPLFVLEIVGALQACQADESYNPERFSLPMTIEEAVQVRIDHLDPDDKDLIKRASVLGDRFWREALEACGATAVSESLRRLCRQRVIRSRPKNDGRLAGFEEYAFRHRIVRDVAYSMLTEQQKIGLHLLVGQWLTNQGGAGAVEAARHFSLGGDANAAHPLWCAAATFAESEGDLDEAIYCLGRAIRGASDPPVVNGLRLRRLLLATSAGMVKIGQEELEPLSKVESDLSKLERAEFLFCRGALQGRQAHYAESIPVLEEALTLYEQLEERSRQSRTYAVMAVYRRFGGLGGSRESARMAVSLADQDVAAQARALAVLMIVEFGGGLLGEALATGEKALAACEEAGDLRRAVEVRGTLAYITQQQGKHSDAIRQLRLSIRQCQRIGNRFHEGYARNNLGLCLLYQGKLFSEALHQQEQAAFIGKEFGHVRLEVAGLSDAASVLLAMGETDRARSHAEAAVALGDGLESEGAARAALAQCMQALGDVENGLKEAEQAHQLLAGKKLWADQHTQLLVVYAELLEQSEAMDEAERMFAEAWQHLNERADALTTTVEERDGFLAATPAYQRLVHRIQKA
jgi:serine/threonine protein kinase/tetratricopeptide (TPR) repeat protein